VYRIFGAVASLDQIIAFGCVLAVVLIGTVVLRLTRVGLRVRAMVDTPAMTSLSGVNPSAISIGVWMVAAALAGLAGLLAAPSSGLTPDGTTALMASGFAAPGRRPAAQHPGRGRGGDGHGHPDRRRPGLPAGQQLADQRDPDQHPDLRDRLVPDQSTSRSAAR